MCFHVKPETVCFSVGDCIVCENVVWMSDPETTWRLVGVQQTHRLLNFYGKIVIIVVVGLSSIFNKVGMSHRIVGHIVLDSEVLNTVSSDGSIVCLVDRIADNM